MELKLLLLQVLTHILIIDSRTYSSAQVVTGVVRKSTSSPYYKNSTINGNVSTTNGLSINVQMILDE